MEPVNRIRYAQWERGMQIGRKSSRDRDDRNRKRGIETNMQKSSKQVELT